MVNQTTSNQSSAKSSQTNTILHFKRPFRSPLLNGLVFVGVVLLGLFMTYNFVVHQLTQLAGDSTMKVENPTLQPQSTPLPTDPTHPY
ncbi:MAG: hypothetical protein ACR2LN_05135 [Candidatus Levyibacteriota bacterium]